MFEKLVPANDNQRGSKVPMRFVEQKMHRLAGLLRNLVQQQEELVGVLKRHGRDGDVP